MMRRSLAISLLLPAISATSLFAAQDAPAPAADARQQLEGTITGVEGLVQVRADESAPWQKATVGMTVKEGAEFRTGPKSAARVQIPPDQTIAIDRLGTMKLLEAAKEGSKVKTEMGMKYGRVRYEIEAAGQEHESTIRSPGASLAVRGTIVSLENSLPFPPQATSLTGRAQYRNRRGAVTPIGGPGAGKAVIAADAPSSASTALTQTYIDPSTANARSGGEQQAILTVPVVSGFTGGGGSIGNIAPPPPNVPPPQVQNNTPGSLIFQLVWTGSSSTARTPDLDLFVISPQGENLCPKDCAPVVPSTGRSPQDNRGGPALTAGQELAFWANSFPVGKYTYSIRHVSGQSADYQLVVVRDGQLVQDPDAGTVDQKNNNETFSVDIPANAPKPPPAPDRRHQTKPSPKFNPRPGIPVKSRR